MVLLIDEVDDKVHVTTFTRGLRPGEFLFSLCKNDLKTMVEMLYNAMKYMNVKDTMIARGGGKEETKTRRPSFRQWKEVVLHE